MEVQPLVGPIYPVGSLCTEMLLEVSLWPQIKVSVSADTGCGGGELNPSLGPVWDWLEGTGSAPGPLPHFEGSAADTGWVLAGRALRPGDGLVRFVERTGVWTWGSPSILEVKVLGVGSTHLRTSSELLEGVLLLW